jgi:asparagine synthase (glutamine-hydrolysing)
MCGLVAVFDDSLSAVEIKELTVELTKRIEHRGPDEVGFHGGDGWGLGHARLSIIDPAAGIQPLISRASGAAVVHNGEIYNHAALRVAISDEREAAGKSPFDFTTGSDSEVVLPLFEDCDTAEAVASRLDGMFGIVVVSADGERLMAARDPCGIKPL